jgi:hypothetical protein
MMRSLSANKQTTTPSAAALMGRAVLAYQCPHAPRAQSLFERGKKSDDCPGGRPFPNPVGQFVEIMSDEPLAQVLLFTDEGRLCLSSHHKRLDLSALPAGTYWVKIVVADGRFAVRRLVRR